MPIMPVTPSRHIFFFCRVQSFSSLCFDSTIMCRAFLMGPPLGGVGQSTAAAGSSSRHRLTSLATIVVHLPWQSPLVTPPWSSSFEEGGLLGVIPLTREHDEACVPHHRWLPRFAHACHSTHGLTMFRVHAKVFFYIA